MKRIKNGELRQLLMLFRLKIPIYIYINKKRKILDLYNLDALFYV